MSTMTSEQHTVNVHQAETTADAVLARGITHARHDLDPDQIDPDAGWDDYEGFVWEVGPETRDDAPSTEDEADYRDWSAETAAREFLDHSERMSLDEFVEHQAEFYRSFGTPGGTLVAEELQALAFKIRLLDAHSPGEFHARLDSLDADARESWSAQAYLDGLEAGRSERTPISTFGHHA